jgi:hypothetical protein
MAGPPSLPWRSVWLPRAITAVALVIGVPLFLRSPPWCDITLYQMAARNILNGGVHYRDIFDTNLPGFVWAMTALYSAFGPNVVALRVLDLLIVLGVVLLIDRLAKWGGATPAARWWALAGAALFYPYTVEMSHAQRDTWMALPGLAAVLLRVRRGMGAGEPTPAPLPSGRGETPAPASSSAGEFSGSPGGAAVPSPVATTLNGAHREQGAQATSFSPSLKGGGWGVGFFASPFRASLVEGLLWGAGVWMKPHVALMALAVWLLTAWRLAGERPRPRRALALDLAGNLVGGLLVGAAGVAWLVASGAWAPFYEVFTEWNPQYMKLAQHEFNWRLGHQLYWFPVWSLGQIVTVPLALLSVLDAGFWRCRRASDPARPGPLGRWLPWQLWDARAGADARFVRGALGGLYLAWWAQALFVQRGFQYAHVPETLLMLGLWASHRWAWAPVALLWLALTSGLWVAADYSPALAAGLNEVPQEERERFLPRHPVTLGERLRLWPECWRTDLTDAERFALWDKLTLHPPHEASIGWQELAEVADYLRARRAKGGEVIGWFDSPHAVYLMLDLDPGFRYMHVYTAISISVGEDETGESGRRRVLEELKRAKERGAKYVISDLAWVALSAHDERQRAAFTGPARSPTDLLPAVVPYPKEFPFNQPTLFRSRNGTGRYVVHLITTAADDPGR